MRTSRRARYRRVIDRARGALAFLAASLALLSGAVGAGPVPPELCKTMEDHGDLGTLPEKFQSLQMIFQLESPNAGARGRLVPNPGGLSKGPGALPADVISKPGYYVGVTQGTEDPHYVYLVRLADPSYVIGEAADPVGGIEGYVVRRPGGVLSTRVPFIPGGRLIICEIMGGKRTVLAAVDLGPGPFSGGGTDFKGKDR